MEVRTLKLIEGLGFEGSTHGMEDILLNYISKFVKSPFSLLKEDYPDEDFMPNEVTALYSEIALVPNLELLISLWSIYCPSQQRLTPTEFWDAIDTNIETSFRTHRDTKFENTHDLRIHYLFQLKEIYYDEHDDMGTHMLEKWKVCLLRTGLREEYSQEDAVALLAAQRLIASKVMETSFENISAEIIWLRYGHRESVLAGATEEEAVGLATNYFEEN